ncbi:unnamed protein product [Polarella glacialis]|uniref:Uncharacterized protein n=1 Tax=Polarella glacialis TaxID=89957 RepID=A0A813FNJ7_POLGL|nr:unnamed protein product [Polarella glacialis]
MVTMPLEGLSVCGLRVKRIVILSCFFASASTDAGVPVFSSTQEQFSVCWSETGGSKTKDACCVAARESDLFDTCFSGFYTFEVCCLLLPKPTPPAAPQPTPPEDSGVSYAVSLFTTDAQQFRYCWEGLGSEPNEARKRCCNFGEDMRDSSSCWTRMHTYQLCCKTVDWDAVFAAPEMLPKAAATTLFSSSAETLVGVMEAWPGQLLARGQCWMKELVARGCCAQIQLGVEQPLYQEEFPQRSNKDSASRVRLVECFDAFFTAERCCTTDQSFETASWLRGTTHFFVRYATLLGLERPRNDLCFPTDAPDRGMNYGGCCDITAFGDGDDRCWDNNGFTDMTLMRRFRFSNCCYDDVWMSTGQRMWIGFMVFMALCNSIAGIAGLWGSRQGGQQIAGSKPSVSGLIIADRV